MSDYFANASPSVLLLIVLASIVVLIRFKTPVGVAFFLAAALLALFFPMSAGTLGQALLSGLFSGKTLFLVFMVSSLLVLSSTLAATKQTNRIIEAFQAMLGSSRLSLVAFPSLIGLLPMPGGAVFSAPMVQTAAEDSDLTPQRLAIANYWFRHIWEYWFPLYPGVILFLEMTGAPIGRFILMQLPMTLITLAAGYVFILRGVSLGKKKTRDFTPQKIARFMAELTPILIVVGLVAGFLLADKGWEFCAGEGFMPHDNMILSRFPLIMGLFLAIGWLFVWRGMTWPTFACVFRRPQLWQMVLMVFGLMVFQSILENCGAVDKLQGEMKRWGVPLVIVVAALPFMVGLILAVMFGMVGASFVFVIPLVLVLPESDRLAWHVYAYTMGYVGMMLSPAHVCFILTVQYFKANMVRTYYYLAPLCLILGVTATALFLIYR